MILSLDELEVLVKAVKRLDDIDAGDPDRAHSEADQVLLDVFTKIRPEVVTAYARVMGRASWWSNA